MVYPYKHTTVSGTFDHLHIGHKKILDTAFNLSLKVSIGVTSEKMIGQKDLSRQIEPYQARLQSVKEYVKEKFPKHTVYFFELSTIDGIALQDKSLDSIVVTRETYENAVKINTQRISARFSKLSIKLVPFVKDASGRVIRSTRIRKGEIDRNGASYKQNFEKKPVFYLPDSLRPLLREPFGEVIKGSEDQKEATAQKVGAIIKKEKPPFIITVGDVVSDLLHKNGVDINLRIIDLHTQRGTVIYKELGSRKVKNYKVINKPGTISSKVAKNTYQILKKGLKHKKNDILIIRGEEDLIALPAILLAPLGTFITYGQVGLGIVLTRVTEDLKKRVTKILSQFK